jgi:hypothetical protein
MLLRFQKAGVGGNYETGNQAFSMRLRFLTTRDHKRHSFLHVTRAGPPATSILNAYSCSLSTRHSSSYAPKRMSCCSAATPIPWTRPGVRSDHTVILTAIDSAKAYPDSLRRVSYLDIEIKKRLKFSIRSPWIRASCKSPSRGLERLRNASGTRVTEQSCCRVKGRMKLGRKFYLLRIPIFSTLFAASRHTSIHSKIDS